MKVLQITSHFPPNVGGVETHLQDLVLTLDKKGFNVFVLTYRPLTTQTKWRLFEKMNHAYVFRIPWFPNLFYKLVDYPILEFLYLFPGLFIVTPFVILIYRPNVIHSHGIVAAFVATFWGKFFKVRSIISLHSIYHFPQKGLYTNFVKSIFNHSNYVFGLSKQSVKELSVLVKDKKKLSDFRYWVDLDKFKKIKGAKQNLGIKDKFVVLFVGRLVEEKGVLELIKASNLWNNHISLMIAGNGPLGSYIKKVSFKNKRIKFIGRIDQNDLPLYYSVADVLIVPSTHEEGFGRVILESLACGTPVIGSSRGAIPEAMNETVGRFITVTPLNIKEMVELFYKKPEMTRKLAANSRLFAESNYSEKNVNKITKQYN